MSAIIRKIVTVVEETHLEMGQKVSPPTRRAAAIAGSASLTLAGSCTRLAACTSTNGLTPGRQS